MTVPNDPKAELATLAREGATAGQAARLREHRARLRERATMARQSGATLRGALLGHDWRTWVTITVCLGLGGSCFLVLKYQAELGLGPDAALAVAIGGLIFFVGVGVGALFLLAARLERATIAWLCGLPFEVHGYFERLQQTPTEHATVEASLTFVDQAPECSLVADLIGRVGGAGARLADEEGGSFKVVSGTIVCPSGDSESTNANVSVWMHRFITEVVTPLHRVYPLATVTFRH